MKNFLELDGNLAFNIALFDRFAGCSGVSYREICGGYFEGVYQWVTHNVTNVIEVKNEKYTGWEIYLNDNEEPKKVYILNTILDNEKVTNWKHAKNLFNKYLKVKK